jgi:FixJ family two-component response regulator
MTIRAAVHLVDDDASYLRATARMLAAEGFQVRSFDSGTRLLADVTPKTRGCIVADLSMPELDGLSLQAALARAEVTMPLLFLSGHGDIPSTVRAMQGGAVDFLEKRAPRERLLAAIRTALERDTREAGRLTARAALRQRFGELTRREVEVLREVVRGQMNKQIAATLGISERTVKLHRTAVKAKVGVQSSARLATLARDAGLFEEGAPPDPGA